MHACATELLLSVTRSALSAARELTHKRKRANHRACVPPRRATLRAAYSPPLHPTRTSFRAWAPAARTPGRLTTLRAGTGASLVANQDDDETVEDDEG